MEKEKSLVRNRGNNYFIASDDLAKMLGFNHKNVYTAIKKHLDDPSEYGNLIKTGRMSGLNDIYPIFELTQHQAESYLFFTHVGEKGEAIKNKIIEDFSKNVREIEESKSLTNSDLKDFLVDYIKIKEENSCLKDTNKKQKKTLGVYKPKVFAYNRIVKSASDSSISEIAAMLNIGSKTFFNMLREKDIFRKIIHYQ